MLEIILMYLLIAALVGGWFEFVYYNEIKHGASVDLKDRLGNQVLLWCLAAAWPLVFITLVFIEIKRKRNLQHMLKRR